MVYTRWSLPASHVDGGALAGDAVDLMADTTRVNAFTYAWGLLALIGIVGGVAGKIPPPDSGAQWILFGIVGWPIFGIVVTIIWLALEYAMKPDVQWRREWWLDWPRGNREKLILIILMSAAFGVGSLVRAITGSLGPLELATSGFANSAAMCWALALWYRWVHPRYFED